jgi:hypothetical protein
MHASRWVDGACVFGVHKICLFRILGGIGLRSKFDAMIKNVFLAKVRARVLHFFKRMIIIVIIPLHDSMYLTKVHVVLV